MKRIVFLILAMFVLSACAEEKRYTKYELERYMQENALDYVIEPGQLEDYMADNGIY